MIRRLRWIAMGLLAEANEVEDALYQMELGEEFAR